MLFDQLQDSDNKLVYPVKHFKDESLDRRFWPKVEITESCRPKERST
jgi:hypothetical protein